MHSCVSPANNSIDVSARWTTYNLHLLLSMACPLYHLSLLTIIVQSMHATPARKRENALCRPSVSVALNRAQNKWRESCGNGSRVHSTRYSNDPCCISNVVLTGTTEREHWKYYHMYSACTEIYILLPCCTAGMGRPGNHIHLFLSALITHSMW